jgi:RecA-family ATPase
MLITSPMPELAEKPRILTGSAYMTLPAPQTFLIEPLLPVGGSMILYGDPKVGKSFAALQLADALVSGADWLGFPIRTPGPVVYIQLDTPRSLWGERLKSLAASGLGMANIHQADRESFETFPFNILLPEHASMLKESLSSIKPVAVIIDTLRECHSAQENESTEMQPVIAALEEAVRPAALILIAHSRKPSEMGHSTINDIRGSNYIPGRMDAIVRFTPKKAYFEGRAIERTSLTLNRLENATWALTESEADRVALLLIGDPAFRTDRERARALHDRLSGAGISLSEEACRSLIRRLKGRVGQTAVGQATDPPSGEEQNHQKEL